MVPPLDPFDDIVSPQPRPARGATFQTDPFEDDGSPNLIDGDTQFERGTYLAGPAAASTSRVQGSYTLDPFFDEFVIFPVRRATS
jgi:hypothetical protein